MDDASLGDLSFPQEPSSDVADTYDALENDTDDLSQSVDSQSPYVVGSGVPVAIQAKIDAGQEDEFQRYAAAIADPSNPLTA